MALMDRKSLSFVLNRIGIMMELLGENTFKANAYYAAARTVEVLSQDPGELTVAGKLREIKGIGDSLARQITELVQTGTSALYEELKEKIPDSLLEMMDISGLGPKKIGVLYRKLGITRIDELENACRAGKLTELAGFGAKTQENILKGIERLKKFTGQHLYAHVLPLAREVEQALANHPDVLRVQVAGSLRRRKEIVKDIDLVASSQDPEAVMAYFVGLPQVDSIVGTGETKSSVLLNQGINADLRVVREEEFPYALHHFTGSQEHNTALRHRAKNMGLKMNEYGLFDHQGQNLFCRDEREIFRSLGLDYIPPELRENMGELEAAEQGTLPDLVEVKDIKGVFHIHTIYSDGTATIEEMARATRARGWNYLGISDHSRSAFYAGGLKVEQVRKQMEEIDAFNEKNPDFTVFKGIGADILKDGSLDYPDEILSGFDFVIASIHSGFKMTEAEATGRLVRAMQNPYVGMLGHPTGRILLGREGYPVDMKTVVDAARDYRVVIELNANPYRLDLDWRWCRYAKEQGVMISLNPDAHHPEELDYVELGVGIARKGWLGAEDLLCTMTREKAYQYLHGKKSSHG